MNDVVKCSVAFFYPHCVPNGTQCSLPFGEGWGGATTQTSLLPNLNNNTTSVENGLSHIINLITSFFAKGLTGLSKLGNKVHAVWAFHATEVVLFIQLGENKVFVPQYLIEPRYSNP